MRKNFGSKPLVFPQPVLIIATYNDDGSVNAMNAAWGGISDDKEIGICLSSHRTTSNILKRKAFTVSMGTKEYVTECDYVGIVSANTNDKKFEKTGFHTIKSEFVDAPIIEELKLAIECELTSYDEETGHLFGKVINTSVDDSVLTDGKIDMNKYHPIIFEGTSANYHEFGDVVAKAFSVGKNIK